jgi:nicotinamide riboside kinase
MDANDRQEFIIMLLIENRTYTSSDGAEFYKYMKKRYNLDEFNKRYMELLDKFMEPYALNKTEKSEEHD